MRRGTYFQTFPATSVLLLLCLSFYALEVYFTQEAQKGQPDENILQSFMGIDGGVLRKLGWNDLGRLKDGELWRLLSCAFLHGGLIHLAFNAWVLADLGRLCEPLLGTERFSVVYIVSGLGGSLGTAAYALITKGSGFSVGASGALMGLIGLLLAFSLRHRDRELRDEIVRWILYMVVFSLFIGRVDHAAHAGGFITGACFGYFTPRYVSSQGARAFRFPFFLAVLATSACLGLALWNFLQKMRGN